MIKEVTLDDIAQDIDHASGREFDYDVRFHREELFCVSPAEAKFLQFGVEYCLSVGAHSATKMPERVITVERKWSTDGVHFNRFWSYRAKVILYDCEGEIIQIYEFKEGKVKDIYDRICEKTKAEAFTDQEKQMLSAI